MSTIESLLREVNSTSTTNLSNAIGASTSEIVLATNDPILFFPLRLEVRFVVESSQKYMCVRAYPDQLLINQHETQLTNNEISAGKTYWSLLFEAKNKPRNGDPSSTKEISEVLWNNLAKSFSAQRAGWIIQRTMPANWEIATTAETLVFPTIEELIQIKPNNHLLPDRLNLIYETELGNSTNVNHEIGNQIPSNLQIVPDLDDDSGSFNVIKSDDGSVKKTTLSFQRNIEWMFDFNKAIEVGMAFKVKIGKKKINWVVVLGVKNTTAESGSKLINELIEGHYYTSDDLILLPQGTPTNNSENNDSGYEQRYIVKNQDYQNYNTFISDVPADIKSNKTDQQRFAEMLGIPFKNSVFQRLGPHRRALNDSQDTGLADSREARLMNTALYPATLGYYLKSALNKISDHQLTEEVRKLFLDQVSGRGPLPILRVGNQPYGVVLSSDLQGIVPLPNDTQEMTRIITFVQSICNELENEINDVVHIGKSAYQKCGNLNTTEVIDKLLQQYPSSIVHQKRRLIPSDNANVSTKKQLARLVGTLPADPLIVNLFPDFKAPIKTFVCYEDEFSNEIMAIGQNLNIKSQVEGSSTDSLSAKTPKYKINYIKWLIKWVSSGQITGSLEDLQQHPYQETMPLLYYILRSALIRQLMDLVNQWLDHERIIIEPNRDDLTNGVLVPMDYLFIKFKDLNPGAVIPANINDKTISSFLFNLSSDDSTNPDAQYGIADLNRSEFDLLISKEKNKEAVQQKVFRNSEFPVKLYESYTRLLEMIEAMYVLSEMPTARLERCFAEHLDTLSYRADAWITGYLSSRLEQLRTGQGGSPPSTGTYVGSYGWLSGVTDRSSIPTDGGFIQAPSLSQAATAALLKTGYMKNETNGSAFAIDLSSERVRKGHFLLEGIQKGYEIPALLGYQFERSLHDRNLDKYISQLRKEFPLKNRRFIDGQFVESSVIDGLAIVKNRGEVVSNITDVDKSKVSNIIDLLDESLDALSDISVAEAVHQYANGNVDRAAAVLKSYSDGATQPEPEFTKTARTNSIQLTNKLCVLNNAISPASLPINSTPRAIVAPELNGWLSQKIGQLLTIRFKIYEKENNETFRLLGELTLNDLDLQPIDLIYIMPNGLMEKEGITPLSPDEWGRRVARAYNFHPKFAEKEKFIERDRLYVDYFSKLTVAKNQYSLSEKYFLLMKLKEVISFSTPLSPGTFDGTDDDYDWNRLITECKSAVYILEESAGGDKLEFLHKASLYGFVDSFQALDLETAASENATQIEEIYQQVFRKVDVQVKEVNKIVSELSLPGSKKDQTLVEKCAKAIKSLFNGTIDLHPKFRIKTNTGSQIAASSNSRARLLSLEKSRTGAFHEQLVVDRWLDSVHHVRSKVAAYNWIRLINDRHDSNADTLQNFSRMLEVWQLPYESTDFWVAASLSQSQLRKQNKTSFVVESDTAITSWGPENESYSYAGFLIDEWVELIPTNEETTGIALNYNSPNSEPPHAMLLALPSDMSKEGWDLLEMARAVLQALPLSALRGISPDSLLEGQWRALLPAIIGETANEDISAIYFKG